MREGLDGAGRLLSIASLTVMAGCQSCHASSTPTSTASQEPPAPAPSALTQVAVVELPAGAPGIGFDDLRFSPALDRVLVPAGRSGRLDLIDPESRRVGAIAGFSSKPTHSGGHDDGVTSADAAGAAIFATDRTRQQLAVVDASSRAIARSVALAAHPDYVRFVEPTRELWVTEPDADQLEIFSLDGQTPAHDATIAIVGGPESLIIDPARSGAYTHLWRGATVAVDLRSRKITARWNNGCRSSRGIALDTEHGFVVAACAEGKATVLDLRDGHIVSELETGAGVDVIDFAPSSRHLYVPSADTATLVVAGLGTDGRLTELGRVATARGAHCVTADDRGNAYVCDPSRGRLLVIHDGLPRATP